jgi:hypothetical protein
MAITVMMAATLDHNGLGVCYRWRRDDDSGERCDHQTNLLHASLSSVERELNSACAGTFPRNQRELMNICSVTVNAGALDARRIATEDSLATGG